MSYFYHDEIGSVEVTSDGSGGSLARYAYSAWGKARPVAGTGAYVTPGYGNCTAALPGQREGFAGHENLTDLCLVNMEGRIYDPDLGRFLSADPNVQSPFSSQGYDRYAYVDNNPLSLTDPTGYFAEAVLGEVISDIGPFLSVFQPFCGVWCTAAAEAVGGYMQSGNNVGTGLEAGTLSLASSESMNAIGGYYGASPSGAYVGGMSAAEALASKTLVEGLVLGALSEAGGGRFGSGFLGGVTGSLAGSYLNSPAFNNLNDPGKILLAALAGGTVSYAAGGNFGTGALAAAFVEAFNDLQHPYGYAEGYPIENQNAGGEVRVPDIVDGKQVGWMYVPRGAVTQVLLAEDAATTPAQYDKPCNLGCWKNIGFGAAAGTSLLTAGSSLGASLLANLADEEEAVQAFENAARTLKGISLVSGGVALYLRPSLRDAGLLGASAAALMIPLPEIQLPIEIFLEAEDLNARLAPIASHPH